MKTSLAEEIRLLRETKKVSIREAGRETGISNAYLSQLERGEASKPSPNVLHKLAEYYEVPYESLMLAAGYIQDKNTSNGQAQIPSAFEAQLMSAKLDTAEKAMILKYIEFLRSQKQ